MPGIGERPRRVLVIEDNPADTLLITEAFENSGCLCDVTIGVANNAEVLLRTQRFDLVLLDFGMPVEEMRARVTLVREHAHHAPIIILSGYPDPIPAYTAGANVFVRKELLIEEFFAKIRALMEFWFKIAELPSGRM